MTRAPHRRNDERFGGRFSRRRALRAAPWTAAVLLGLDPRVPAAAEEAPPSPAGLAAFPQQDPELVREVVLKSHFDLDRVEELVKAWPELAKSAIDWGFGDWESALGAASHTGRREIASLLIHHGARPNLFTHAMLGHLDVVRAAVAASPGVQTIPGPHGITLLAHARAGGEPARAVLDYLEDLGDADPVPPKVERPMPAEAYTGAYCVGTAAGETFRIVERDEELQFEKEGMFPRALIHLGGGEHHPTGAPSVRLTFETGPERAAGLEIRLGRRTLSARRCGES